MLCASASGNPPNHKGFYIGNGSCSQAPDNRQTVLVLDRKVPVARITPIAKTVAAGHKMTNEERLVYLESIGAIRRDNGDVREWLKHHKPARHFRGSVLKALLEERESGR